MNFSRGAKKGSFKLPLCYQDLFVRWVFFFYSIAKGCMLYSMLLMVGEDRGVAGCIGIWVYFLILWVGADVEGLWLG